MSCVDQAVDGVADRAVDRVSFGRSILQPQAGAVLTHSQRLRARPSGKLALTANGSKRSRSIQLDQASSRWGRGLFRSMNIIYGAIIARGVKPVKSPQLLIANNCRPSSGAAARTLLSGASRNFCIGCGIILIGVCRCSLLLSTATWLPLSFVAFPSSRDCREASALPATNGCGTNRLVDFHPRNF